MRKLFIAAVFYLVFGSPAFAGAGKDSFEILNLDLSPRQAAMAGVASPYAPDADEFARDPGSLGFVRTPEASFSRANLPLSVTLESAAYVHPQGPGAFGIRAALLDVGGLTGYDEGGAPTGDVKAQSFVGDVGYGRRLANGTAVGAVVKQVRQTLGSDNASLWALDAGWSVPMRRLPLCWELAALNVGSKSGDAPLPRLYEAGASYRGFRGALDASLSLRRGSDGRTTGAAGAEVWIDRALALRAGYDTTQGMGRGFSVGLGFRVGGLRVDYSFAAQAQGFDPVNRFGLSYRFASPADRAYQEGLALSREGRNAEAIYKFKEALDDDPNILGAVQALRSSAEALEKQTGKSR